MQRAEKKKHRKLESDRDVSICLVEMRESAFLDEPKKAIEMSIGNNIDIIFTPTELRQLSRCELVSNGVGGTCDMCGKECEDSVFLEMEFEFITLHSSCYKYLQNRCSIYYNRHKSDIVSFTL